MSDDFLFAEEDEELEAEELETWKVMVVDDEPEMHSITKLALSDFVFQGKGLEFISAYSGSEAKSLILEHPDTAIVLLDVVMETDDAGLKVAEFIRDDARNYFSRIILRTGQPGQAPERDVIINYEINDYKSKTELTAQKLFTVVLSALRSYRDILKIENNRSGLEKIIQASADIFSIHCLEQFIEGVVQQISALLGGKDSAYMVSSAVCRAVANQENSDIKDGIFIFNGYGDYKESEGKLIEEVLSLEVVEACNKMLVDKGIYYGEDFIVAYCQSKSDLGSIFYITGLPKGLNETDREMVEIFAQNIQIAFDNILFTQDIEETERELLIRLGESIETRKIPKTNHAKRLALYCSEMGKLLGFSHKQIQTITIAAPLHDVGKVGISETVLCKPGKLDDEEWKVMQTHAQLGHDILQNSQKPIIQAASKLALDLRERWDGSGYPNGKSGEEINLYSRIIAIVDCFDTLCNKRCYKEEWTVDDAIEAIKADSGKHFEPKLVDLFLENIDKFEAILELYPDPE